MQTVLLTTLFQKQANATGIGEDGLYDIVTTIARNPLAGDLMVGTGGARKLRHAARGKGKSGGVRTIHYFGGDDIPVFLLGIYGKDAKANLTMSERIELAKLLPTIGPAYREFMRKKK
jgi:hypothetical protein